MRAVGQERKRLRREQFVHVQHPAGKPALLIVDVQEAMITGAMYRESKVLDNIVGLLAQARAAGVWVIHVRHDYGDGHEWARGTPGWKIWQGVAPLESEPIVDKRHNSAFMRTNLYNLLRERGVKETILTGVHTEYCIDATVRSAFERDFRVTIPELTNTTHGNEYMTAPVLYDYYHRKLWNGRYATVVPLESVIDRLHAERR